MKKTTFKYPNGNLNYTIKNKNSHDQVELQHPSKDETYLVDFERLILVEKGDDYPLIKRWLHRVDFEVYFSHSQSSFDSFREEALFERLENIFGQGKVYCPNKYGYNPDFVDCCTTIIVDSIDYPYIGRGIDRDLTHKNWSNSYILGWSSDQISNNTLNLQFYFYEILDHQIPTISRNWKLSELIIEDHHEITENKLLKYHKKVEKIMGYDWFQQEKNINKKEKNMKKLLGNFEFGAIETDQFALTLHGQIGIKGKDGSYYTYDVENNTSVDVMDFVIDDFEGAFYKMPVQEVKKGDIIMTGSNPVIVKEVNRDGSIIAVDPVDGSSFTKIKTTNIFGFNLYTKVVSIFDMMNQNDNGNNIFGNMNPMMFLMLKNDGSNGSSNKLLEMMMMSQMFQGGNAAFPFGPTAPKNDQKED
jgi:hypothetical protein